MFGGRKYRLCPSSWAVEMEGDFCCDKLKMLKDFQAVGGKNPLPALQRKKAMKLLCCPQIPVGDWSPNCLKKAIENKAQLQPAGQV